MRAGLRSTCVAALAAGALVPLTAACGSSGSAPPPTQADLTATLDLGAPGGGAPQTWQVSCPSAAHAVACTRLVTTTDAFMPPPPDTGCTMIYGGPEVLAVTGTVGTRHVDYRTGRTNGCEIADYARDLALVAPFRHGGVTVTTPSAG